MNKNKIKFAISVTILLITAFLVFFYDEYFQIYKKYMFPILFVYFLLDNLIILLPKIYKYIPNMKYSKKFYQSPPKFDKNKLESIKKSNNKRALFTFILYFGALTFIGLAYQTLEFLEDTHIYLLFLLLNAMDYFCILIWCPFKDIILKNSCCYTCRITNWDRFMKSYILVFVPNVFTLTIVFLGFINFIIWEFNHQIHPERFYSISNNALRCNSCMEV